jgi:alpha-D-ribose 1-methylphosphonate 5-triphosphate synthase subunit PhnI
MEFVMYHSDNVEAQGFVQHLKLPHYIDFQAELSLVRKMRQEHSEVRSHKSEVSNQENGTSNPVKYQDSQLLQEVGDLNSPSL